MTCLKYDDAPSCPGYEGNKLCAHCDRNERGFTPLIPVVAEENKKYDKEEKIKTAMQKVLTILEGDNLEIVARAVFKAPEGSTYSKPSDHWSFLNRILMLSEDTEDARTYRQWQEAGRQVTKGSKAFAIFKPLGKKIEDKKTGEEKYVLYGFGTIPVFKIEDTEGEALPDAPRYDFQIPANFQTVVDELHLSIKTMVFNGGTYGYFAPSRQTIALASPEIEIFLHEISHAVDHKINGALKGGQHNDQEVTAEYSAAVVGHMLGYKMPFGNIKQYLTSYSFKELMSQLNRCEKVITFIVERTTTNIAPILSPAPSISSVAIQQEV